MKFETNHKRDTQKLAQLHCAWYLLRQQNNSLHQNKTTTKGIQANLIISITTILIRCINKLPNMNSKLFMKAKHKIEHT